ncbi:unnamed protein product [Ilex paraguariensis]|uniref:Uncharacterized protein n=1 Tax=Ilex paraguariensis TaxID=185542 RepID=A0ABC8S932_9AQUA
MAAESNTGFPPGQTLGAALNRHAISFQSGAINSTSEMIPMGNYYGHGVNSMGGMTFSGNSSIMKNNSGIATEAGNSSPLLLDSMPGLKHDRGFAVEWSVEEQYKLEEDLVKFKLYFFLLLQGEDLFKVMDSSEI